MDVGSFTKENPAYLYSVDLAAELNDMTIAVSPIYQFRMVATSKSPESTIYKVLATGDSFINPGSYFVADTPLSIQTDDKNLKNLMYCWSPDPDSYEARVKVLEAAINWWNTRSINYHIQMVDADDRAEQFQELLREEWRKYDGQN